MTVSTISGLPGDVRRALDQQAKPSTKDVAKQSASLPTDSIAASGSSRAPALDVDAAIIQTQAQNREAAAAYLSDADLDVIETQATPQQQVAAQPEAATAAQTNKLPVDLVKLASE